MGWRALPREQWDSFRVRVPGFVPKPGGVSHYTISLLGRIRRPDGLVWQFNERCNEWGVPYELEVCLAGRRVHTTLSKLMHRCFAIRQDIGSLVPWHDYRRAPFDELTGARSAAIDYFRLVSRGERQAIAQGRRRGLELTRFRAYGRDVPIPRDMLTSAGYVFDAKGHATLVDCDGVCKIDRVHIA